MKFILFSAILLILPSSLFARDSIIIKTKLLESSEQIIPHDLAIVAKTKGIDLLTTPSVVAPSGEKSTIEITREQQLASVAPSKFKPMPTGVTMTITPHLVEDKISFSAKITISEIIGEKKEEAKTQAEFSTRTIFLSGIQNKGEAGWYDLVNPRKDKEGTKITVWISLDAFKADK